MTIGHEVNDHWPSKGYGKDITLQGQKKPHIDIE